MMFEPVHAVFRDGAFYPSSPCPLPNDLEVVLHVQPASAAQPVVIDAEERRQILQRVTDRMRSNPLPPETPPMTREWLHERG